MTLKFTWVSRTQSSLSAENHNCSHVSKTPDAVPAAAAAWWMHAHL